MTQYPYIFQILQANEAVFDENSASWVEGSATWKTISKCRDEINGGGGKITRPDGEVYIFGAVVYLPQGTDGVKDGDKIQVLDGAMVRLTGHVKKFSKTQLHSRLWL